MSEKGPEGEVWRDVPGYEGLYQVSTLGRVKSVPKAVRYGFNFRYVRAKILKPRPDEAGYLQVVLCKGKTHRQFMVHRLVLEAFVGPCPEGMEGCHHPDNDITNCKLTNLRWDTHKANCADKEQAGTVRRGEDHKMAKLTEAQVREIRDKYATGEFSQDQLAKEYGISPYSISLVVRKKTWRHIA